MDGFDYMFDKIFVLKSLGESDEYADKLYTETIQPCCEKCGLANEPPIEIFDSNDWDAAIDKILQDEHRHPFVHIETHGDREKGLKLRLGDYISWDKMLEDLRKVNIRSGMNLIVTMATCFSIKNAFHIKMYGLTAPYLMTLTARDEEINSSITFALYTILFKELINTGDFYKALKRVEIERPDLPQHFVHLELPTLFENAWKGMAERYKNGEDVVKQFYHSFPEFQSEVIKKDISRAEYEGYRDGFVQECNPTTINFLYGACRRVFFMYDLYPSNRLRFVLDDTIL